MQILTSAIASGCPEQLWASVPSADDRIPLLRAGSVRQLSHTPSVSHAQSCDLLLSLCHSSGLPAVPAEGHTSAARAAALAVLSLCFASAFGCCCWVSSAQRLLWHAQPAWLLLFTSLQLKMKVDLEMTGVLDGKAALCLPLDFLLLYHHP